MRTRAFLAAGSVMLLGIAACGSNSAEQAESSVTVPSPGEVLFADDFVDDRNGWGEFEIDIGRSKFVDGDNVAELFGAPILAGFPDTLQAQRQAGELELRNIIVRAQFTVPDLAGVAGVLCRWQPGSEAAAQWYEFVVRDGYAAIRRSDINLDSVETLVESTEVDLPNGQQIQLDGGCVDRDNAAQLSLTVNGSTVLTTSVDEPLGEGEAGTVMYPPPDLAASDTFLVKWHNFTVFAAEE